ncbi:MAG: tripartite tricarboxylate transporter substrate binding protein [Burkholderiales bacterium]|nr:tripartite tricarboxylate transporter substrate binding protein [Burkholderiales bacterium]
MNPIAVIALACTLVAPAIASAQDAWPVRPVRMIAPFTPAGATDILSRLTADALSKRLGQNVVVENRPGAGANLGGELAMRAAPDGYTILMAPSTVYAAGVTLYAKPKFDLARDFIPVATLAYVPHVLVVAAEVHAKNVQELIALAKSQPDRLIMASQGVGTISQLEGELFQHMAGIEMTHVPYKGSQPAHVDLMGGRVQVMFDSVAAALPHIRTGKLRALGVTTPTRVAQLPDVPTIAEAGLPGYVAESWLGIFTPAGVPKPIVTRLQRELTALGADPVFAQKLADSGFEVRVQGTEAYAQLIQRETVHWAAVVKRARITLE